MPLKLTIIDFLLNIKILKENLASLQRLTKELNKKANVKPLSRHKFF
jgi:hypothetical protein